MEKITVGSGINITNPQHWFTVLFMNKQTSLFITSIKIKVYKENYRISSIVKF